MSKWLAILAVLATTTASAAGFNIGGKPYPSLQAAMDAAQRGDTVEVAPGEYHEAGIVRASGLTLAFAPAAKFSGVAAEGKAMLVIKGNDTTVTGLDCSEIGVPGGNGACIRLEGRNLTLDRVHFHDMPIRLAQDTSMGSVPASRHGSRVQLSRRNAARSMGLRYAVDCGNGCWAGCDLHVVSA